MLTIVAGARPNFMKIAPIIRALGSRPYRLVHTGQHFDAEMSDVFFRDLEIPEPTVKLELGGGSQASQTAAILVAIEAELKNHRPTALLVVGDVTSTVASALAAAKLSVPVIHLEAGLRSRDWRMPEEINRVVTDQLSDLLLTTSPEAAANLAVEGIGPERVVFVGNVMIDALQFARARPTDAIARLGLKAPFGLATMHRPANVDDSQALERTFEVLAAAARQLPIVFPVHPRTRQQIAQNKRTQALLAEVPTLLLQSPLGYRDFVTLMSSATLVLTDSGGIQEETTSLGVPCLTLRDNTERPITVTVGTNSIVGLDTDVVIAEVAKVLGGEGKRGTVVTGWDGHAAERVVAAIDRFFAGSPPARVPFC